ncbi:MAG: ATP-binding protein [Okeania sp. SIO2C9]|uniref:ATP-binding protein n=1 Tax=Okeania sp. SIO2C9 TaxID=2607791 RepID=UPI0013BFA740|nr:ATP-binding protein [Okeania sp. SIO2C9]NEQ75680.1 ATP-binding protein [Okeania sp. SIO2C9]
MTTEQNDKPLSNQNQTARDLTVSGSENPVNFVNTTEGTVSVNQSRHVTYNYYSEVSTEKIIQQQLIKDSPYQGLKRFNFQDREYFFGRDALINKLFAAVNKSSFTLVLGASGSGKSSLVRAGVIPKLKTSLNLNKFYDFIFTPNDDPFESLYRCLLSEEKDYKFSKLEAKISLISQADTLPEVISKLKKEDEKWLIFVDQFEELFTSCHDLEKRNNFIENLVRVANSQDSSVKIILAMRADFLEQLSSYPELGIIVNQNNLHLLTDMHPDELKQAIELPAAKNGVVFEEGLVKQIIKEVEGQKGYLPLLQYTLDLLWQSECQTIGSDGRPNIEDRILNKANYAALEGVRGALQKRINDIYQNLNQDEQSATKQIFVKLVNIIDTNSVSKTVSRRANRSEFVGELVNNTLSTFIDENLLVSSAEDLTPEKLKLSESQSSKQSATVEIAHEILLSSWDRLKNWVEEEKEAILLKNWLASETRRWQKIRLENESKGMAELLKGSRLEQVIELRKKDAFKNVGGLRAEENQFIDVSIKWQQQQEQQKKNRRRNTILSLATFSVISLGLASFAGIQLLEVKKAEQLRQQELIRSAWISLKPLKTKEQEGYYQEKDEECGTTLDYGLRDLYCKIKPFADYRKLIAISGLPIFISGPHSDSELNFDGGYEFGYYNPEFLNWIQENVIIDPGDNLLKQSIQSAYNDKIRVVARAFYQSHKILFANPEELKAVKDEYQQHLIEKNLPDLYFERYWEFGKKLEAQTKSGLEYKYIVMSSAGFWVRRSMDGTEKQFFDMLTKLLSIYDKDWLDQQELMDTKPFQYNQ